MRSSTVLITVTRYNSFGKICDLDRVFLLKATLKEYDVYISGSKDDAEVSARIQDELRRVFPKIRIKVGSDQKMMEGESWQDDMYNTMMKSSRVITGIIAIK